MKRAVDFLLAGFGMVALMPLFLLIGLLIKLLDFGPVFFVQERVGRAGRVFRMFKFRTMRVDNAGPTITASGDPRITAIGGVLRALKFDELPQLWNVLKGEMSLVGPRPEVPRYVAQYNDAERKVLALRPGITDLASLAYYNESDLLGEASDPELYYRQVLVPDKIRINLAYSEKANILWDLIVIMATVLRPLGLSPDLFQWLKIKAADPASTRSPSTESSSGRDSSPNR